MAKSIVEEIKYPEGQQNLSEDQERAIAAEAIKEIKTPATEDEWVNPADKISEEQSVEDKIKDEAKIKSDADSKIQEETDKKVQVDAKIKADQDAADLKAKDDTKAAAEGDREAQTRVDVAAKAKLEAKEGDKKVDHQTFKIAPEVRTKAIEELALKESLTLEEAEAQIAKDEATVNKYKNDPVEIARELRHQQRLADKAKAELDSVKRAGNTPPAPVIENVKDYVVHQLEPIKDKVIAAYRKEYPELSDGQEDNYVYGLIKKDTVDRTLKVMEENQSKLVSAAKEKRATLIMGLAEYDKAFLPDIKAILDRTNDRQIMAKEYDIKDVVAWAKGRQLDRLVKEAEDRGFKRGQENAKIIGEKIPGGGGRPAGQATAKKAHLTETQQQRARDMFDSVPGMNEQEMFDAYIDTYPEEFKKNKE